MGPHTAVGPILRPPFSLLPRAASGDDLGEICGLRFPACFCESEPGDEKAGDDLEDEDPKGELFGGDGGIGDTGGGVVEAGFAHRLEHAGPTPVGGNEGADDGSQRFGQGKDGTGKG